MTSENGASSTDRSAPPTSRVASRRRAASEAPEAPSGLRVASRRRAARSSNSIEIGESFVGSGAEAAHLNTVLGPREGPVGAAWATALATPSAGHAPYMVVLRPGLPVQPPTLFVNKAAIAGDEHAHLTWGAAQAGVAGGVADALAEDIVPADRIGVLVLIAAVWVSPAARDAAAVYHNNRAATRAALAAGRAGSPSLAEVLAARETPWNPFFDPR